MPTTRPVVLATAVLAAAAVTTTCSDSPTGSIAATAADAAVSVDASPPDAPPPDARPACTKLFGEPTDNTGIALTESYAMTPGASVSGYYFAPPDAHYFSVDHVGEDQVQDYAKRKGWSNEVAEKWLRPILAYQPTESSKELAKV